MTVELTPSGTRGERMPRPPGPLMGVVDALGAAAYHRFGERMRIAGLPVLLLTTYGARSGARRRSMLGWLPDGDDAWLIYATAGGAARHPGWYFNLARNPDRVWIDVRKRHLHGAGVIEGRRARGRLASRGREVAPLRRLRTENRPTDPGGQADRGRLMDARASDGLMQAVERAVC